jgi:hypothetical protein
MELLESNNHEIGNDNSTLFLLGGVALMVFGAGLVISNPFVRSYLSRMGVGNLVQAAIPDVERYFRLRAM